MAGLLRFAAFLALLLGQPSRGGTAVPTDSLDSSREGLAAPAPAASSPLTSQPISPTAPSGFWKRATLSEAQALAEEPERSITTSGELGLEFQNFIQHEMCTPKTVAEGLESAGVSMRSAQTEGHEGLKELDRLLKLREKKVASLENFQKFRRLFETSSPADQVPSPKQLPATLHEALSQVKASEEAKVLFLRWDFKCLAELREKEETNSKAATPLFGRRLSGDSSTEDAIESAATPSSLAYKHGVLLQDRLPRAQEERLRSSLEDRAFALGALATALNHSLETFATSCSCFFERLALQGPEAAEFGCEENGESSCRDALIRALLTPSPDSPGVLVASFLPALQVDIVTLSNGKRLQDEGLSSAEALFAAIQQRVSSQLSQEGQTPPAIRTAHGALSCVSLSGEDMRGEFAGSPVSSHVPDFRASRTSRENSRDSAQTKGATTRDKDDPLFRAQWHLQESEGLFNLAADSAWQRMKSASLKDGCSQSRKSLLSLQRKRRQTDGGVSAECFLDSSEEAFTVAVLDTGCGPHEDLTEQLWRNAGETNCEDGVDDDGNGFADDCFGWDFVRDSKDVSDSTGHGTATASLIAAKAGNSKGGRVEKNAAGEDGGVAGVASHAKVMCLRVGDEEGFLLSRQLQAIDYLIQMGAKVSLHPYVLKEQVSHRLLQTRRFFLRRYSEVYKAAIERLLSQNHLAVAAAGNEDCDLDDPEQCSAYPASFLFQEPSNLLVVGGSEYSGSKLNKSNYGKQAVHLFAPGKRLYTASIIQTTPPENTCTTCYAFVHGSSFAAALVAGVAAALWNEAIGQGHMRSASLHAPQSLGPFAAVYEHQSDSALKFSTADEAEAAEEKNDLSLFQAQTLGKGVEGEAGKTPLRSWSAEGLSLATKTDPNAIPVLKYTPKPQLARNEPAALQIKRAILYNVVQSYRLAGACASNGVANLLKALKAFDSPLTGPPPQEFPDNPSVFKGRLPRF